MDNFLSFVQNFLLDKNLGSLPFFKDKNKTYAYLDLVHDAQIKAYELSLLPDVFLALQMDSSYKLFVHLLAGQFARKEMLIISTKEPEQAILEYKKRIGFTRLLQDDDLNGSQFFPMTEISSEKILFSILSSGSSGPSKAIGLSLQNVHASAQSAIDYFHMNETHTSFLNLPHHHIGGLMILWRAFFSRGSVSVNPDDHYDFISLVPLQLQRALNENEGFLKKLQATKAILIGGATLSASLRNSGEAQCLKLYETYGMSETSSLVMLNGIPLSRQTIKLDEAGHFLIKGPTLSPFVKKDSEGFFHTKDLGVKNADGTFSFMKRSDLLFKSAGEMIDPLEIEKVLKELPWITEAVIVPIDHPEWTKASVLVYQTNDEAKNESDIKNYLREKLHPYQIPKFFYTATSTLFTPGMKPKRFEINYWAQDQYYKNLFNTHLISSGEKRLMVLFHGFMEDQEDMAPLMDNNYKCDYLFLDLPGHGQSKMSAFKNRQEVFTLLNKMISFYQRGRELLFYGYSMGGRVALELALSLKVKTLILESASFGLLNDEERLKRKLADQKLFSNVKDLKNFFDSWYENPIFANYNQSPHFQKEIERKLKKDSPQEDWQKSLEFFSPGVAPKNLEEALGLLKNQKILGIVGSLDLKYIDHYYDVLKELKGLSVYEISEAGHNPHKTHLKAIKDILNSVID